jgi:hypothetical protein
MTGYETLTPEARCALALLDLEGAGPESYRNATVEALEELYNANLIWIRAGVIYLTKSGRLAWARQRDDFFLAQEWPCAG